MQQILMKGIASNNDNASSAQRKWNNEALRKSSVAQRNVIIFIPERKAMLKEPMAIIQNKEQE